MGPGPFGSPKGSKWVPQRVPKAVASGISFRRRFWIIFGVHVCIKFFDRFWTGFGMNFLSEVQMFHNAGTLKKLFWPQFFQCFVNVALFRTCTEIIDNVLWNAKKQASNFF